MAQRRTSIDSMSGPHKVKAGKALRWPKWLYDPRLGVPRGTEGYVVDLDRPWEKVLCANQAQVLEPAPGAQASPIEHKPALLWLRKHGHVPNEPIRKIRMGQAMAERAEQAKGPQSDLPGLDEPPGVRRRGSRATKEDVDAVEGETGTAGA